MAPLGAGNFIGASAGAAFSHRGPSSLVAQAILLALPDPSSAGDAWQRQVRKAIAPRANRAACLSEWLSLVYGKLLLDLPDHAHLW